MSDSNKIQSNIEKVYDIAIIGTGFSGLGMAVKLKEKGYNNFIIIERAKDVGGTWRDNDYPGAACDVPSHLYSFSFEPNPHWSKTFPSQPELHTYLRGVAKKHDIYPHVKFNTNLEEAKYNEDMQCWVLKTSTCSVICKTLIAGNGALAEPKLPNIPGIENYQGHHFHSAKWDHEYDLGNKRVAVIGTGASAIQFVPKITDRPKKLDVYQRTPNWIMPREDKPYSKLKQWTFKWIPGARLLHRAKIYINNELRVLGFVFHTSILSIYKKIGLEHIAEQIRDADLRQKVTPSYPIGCKRILLSNDWYPALQKKNVSLVTEGISKVEEKKIISNTGEVREYDCIIFATGFYATENPIAEKIIGRAGRRLSTAWSKGEGAYLSTTVHGFPNMFLITGPNSGLGHSSMVYVIESQIKFILKLLEFRSVNGEIEVNSDIQKKYNDQLQEVLGNSIWATGCDSWYKDANGRIAALWPGFSFTFRNRLKLNQSDYSIRPSRS